MAARRHLAGLLLVDAARRRSSPRRRRARRRRSASPLAAIWCVAPLGRADRELVVRRAALAEGAGQRQLLDAGSARRSSSNGPKGASTPRVEPAGLLERDARAARRRPRCRTACPLAGDQEGRGGDARQQVPGEDQLERSLRARTASVAIHCSTVCAKRHQSGLGWGGSMRGRGTGKSGRPDRRPGLGGRLRSPACWRSCSRRPRPEPRPRACRRYQSPGVPVTRAARRSSSESAPRRGPSRRRRVPRHPFMAPERPLEPPRRRLPERRLPGAGPLGRNPRVSSTLFARECASVAFDSPRPDRHRLRRPRPAGARVARPGQPGDDRRAAAAAARRRRGREPVHRLLRRRLLLPRPPRPGRDADHDGHLLTVAVRGDSFEGRIRRRPDAGGRATPR